MENIFEKLNSVNVNNHTEQKNGLTYLSWAWAWAEVKKVFPTATYTIYENEHGWNYFTDGKTCWVKTGVTIEGLEHIEYLPVMDFKNKSIPFETVTSFDVNKAIQRSLTKACARHGLGLYVYAGEDLPEEEKQEQKDIAQKKLSKIDENQMEVLKALMTANGIEEQTILSLYNVKALEEITNQKYENIQKNIEKIKQKQEEKK